MTSWYNIWKRKRHRGREKKDIQTESEISELSSVKLQQELEVFKSDTFTRFCIGQTLIKKINKTLSKRFGRGFILKTKAKNFNHSINFLGFKIWLDRQFKSFDGVLGKFGRVFMLQHGPCCPNYPWKDVQIQKKIISYELQW